MVYYLQLIPSVFVENIKFGFIEIILYHFVFHLSIDAFFNRAISQLESTASRYLKKWLNLPRSAT